MSHSRAYRLSSLLLLLVVGLTGFAQAASERKPPIRTGIWVMQKLPEDPSSFEEFSSHVRSNSHLSGVCLNFAWKTIEKEQGKPDFTALDKTVDVLRKLNMKYQLCLKPGANTPDFVYNQGAQAFPTQVTNPHRADVGQAIRIPVPWDLIYEKDFSSIIQELGQRYASDPLCVSVVLTCANFVSAEMHLPKTRGDISRWAALGHYDTKLLEVYKRYTDEWATAFPKQEVSLHLAKVLDLPISFTEQIVDYGASKYPDRFTIQNCQLTGRREDIGNKTYELVLRYRDRIHHGFQSLAGLSHPNDRMGSVEMAALNVVHAQGEYWELWHGDGMSSATSAAVAKAWDDAKQAGYEGYKQKLAAEGKYRN
ncbi:MAG: beta-galactosidase [Chthoniobacterales bacterium]|nr:beta-galactosidase [Chthoniobacterales bacterium]